MKLLLPHMMMAILCSLIFSGACLAADEVPKHVRVSVQFIEVSHPALTEWLGQGESGALIHQKAMAQAKSGEAKILETCMVVSRSGQKALVESVLEEIYPTECIYPYDLTSTPDPSVNYTMNPVLRALAAFQTKNVGISLEIQSTVEKDGKIVNLAFLTEFLQRLRLQPMMEHKDQWGDATLRRPIYEKWNSNTSLTLQSGTSELASVITPEKQPPVPAVSRRVLIFVRADVIESR